MYEEASNYNPSATVADLSCVFEIPGCPFAAAANYNPAATMPKRHGRDPRRRRYDDATTFRVRRRHVDE